MIKATYSDKKTVIDILCQSFDTNISVNYVVKQGGKREKRIRKLMEYSFDVCIMFGTVYLSKDKNACALTLLPDLKKMTLKSILLDLKMAFSCIGLTRLKKVLARDSKIKNSYPAKPILYLWFIGVNAKEQNKGIGSELLQKLIKQSELLQRPIYLETSMKPNVHFYEKHGFEVYKELDFGHKLFLLNRELI